MLLIIGLSVALGAVADHYLEAKIRSFVEKLGAKVKAVETAAKQ